MTRALIGALLAMVTAVPLGAGQFGMFGKTKTKTFTAGDFSMQYPDGGGWRLTPGAQDVLALINKQPDVRVAVIRVRQVNAVSVDDDELLKLFAQLEADEVRVDIPDAGDLGHAIVGHATLGRIVRIDFTRPSVTAPKPGVRERAQLFSIPAGSVLYRVVFSASPREFDKEAPRFAAMLDSVRIGKPASQGDAP